MSDDMKALVERLRADDGRSVYIAGYDARDPDKVAAAATIERLERALAEERKWIDSRTTFYDVDADYDVEGRNIPALARVSERIWYHATDDVTSYPFSTVIDAAIAKERG